MTRRILAVVLCGLALGAAGCGMVKTPGQVSSENLTDGAAFLAANAKAAGVSTLPSGVQYKVVRSGPEAGLRPKVVDEVKVHYEGKLLDGRVFDSSYRRGVPAAFTLQGLIPAWTEALQLMRPGDEWTLWVPPEQGYGEFGAGPIPGNSVLVFRIELLDVLPHPSSVGRG